MKAEVVFRFSTVVQYDKKGDPFDASEALTESISASCPTELSNLAEARRQELNATLVNFHFTEC